MQNNRSFKEYLQRKKSSELNNLSRKLQIFLDICCNNRVSTQKSCLFKNYQLTKKFVSRITLKKIKTFANFKQNNVACLSKNKKKITNLKNSGSNKS